MKSTAISLISACLLSAVSALAYTEGAQKNNAIQSSLDGMQSPPNNDFREKFQEFFRKQQTELDQYQQKVKVDIDYFRKSLQGMTLDRRQTAVQEEREKLYKENSLILSKLHQEKMDFLEQYLKSSHASIEIKEQIIQSAKEEYEAKKNFRASTHRQEIEFYKKLDSDKTISPGQRSSYIEKHIQNQLARENIFNEELAAAYKNGYITPDPNSIYMNKFNKSYNLRHPPTVTRLNEVQDTLISNELLYNQAVHDVNVSRAALGAATGISK